MIINWLKFLIADVLSSHFVDHHFMGQRSKHSGDESGTKSDTPYTTSDAISEEISNAISKEIEDAVNKEFNDHVEDIKRIIVKLLVLRKAKIYGFPLDTKEAIELDCKIMQLRFLCNNYNGGIIRFYGGAHE